MEDEDKEKTEREKESREMELNEVEIDRKWLQTISFVHAST